MNLVNMILKSWMKEFEKLVTSKDQTFILICAHANRTRDIGNFSLIGSRIQKIQLIYLGGMALWAQELRETISYK